MASNGSLVWFLVIYLSFGISWTTACSAKKAQSPINECTTDICRHSAQQILNYMDQDVDPCNDFYKFTCGRFLRLTTIPYNRRKISTDTALINQVKDQLRKVLEEESPPNELRAFKLAKNFYKACSNKTHVKEKGLKPLLAFFKSLGGWPVIEGDKWAEQDFNWIEAVFKMNDAGFPENFFMEWNIVPHPENKTKQLPAIFAPSSHYTLSDNGIRSAYYELAIDTAVFLGADRHRATEELEEAVRFEKNLAKIFDEIYPGGYPWTYSLKTLTRRFPKIPWTEYYSKILKIPTGVVSENEEIAISGLEYDMKFHEFYNLINSVPKKVQSNYVMLRIATDFFRHDFNKCIEFMSSSMFMSVGALYFRKYITEDTKVEIGEMVGNIMEQLRILIQNADWVDDNTKKLALDKLESIGSFIQFSEQLWDDAQLEELHKDLVLDVEDYFHSYLNLSRFELSAISRRLVPFTITERDTVIENEYISASYRLSRNRMILGAGILQGHYFNSIRPKYMNYGAIGSSTIGHEITHGFDSDGQRYDKNGKKGDWWVEETVKKFMTKSQCMVYQYGNYTVQELGRNLNGTRSLDENIADNGGAKTAYLAYREWVRRNGPEPTLPNLPYSANQLFWISAGQSWCINYSKSELDYMTTAAHAPSEFRVNGPLSNLPEFADDFKCPIGSKMNPINKCSVW